MEDQAEVLLSPLRSVALLLGPVDLLALALAALGLYGVVSFAVAARTREVRIRTSLGADRGVVIASVQSGVPAVVAMVGVAGLATALGAARFIHGVLFGVGPGDSATFIGVPLLLGAVAALAALFQARKATRVDAPLEALRSE